MIMRRPCSRTATRRDHLAEGARNAQVTARQVKEQAKGFRFGVLTGEPSVRPGDFPMAGVQFPDLIPHSFLRPG